MAEVAETLRKVAGDRLAVERRVSADPQYLTDNPQRRRPDLGKLRTLTGWKAVVSLEEGLARTLRSYREIGVAAS